MFNVSPAIKPVIDIGANLTHESFHVDFDQCVLRAKQANVAHMIVTGSDLDQSQKAIELARRHPTLFSATAGIHPHYAEQFNDNASSALTTMIAAPEVAAVGETGLDFFRDISPREKQQSSFIAHIELAKKFRKPLFLHQRDAHQTFLAILKEHRSELEKIVIHCFTDTAEALQDYLELDCHIGITGWICDERRGTHLLHCVKSIPLNRLMIETDAPYLMPRSILPKPKTRRNEPCTLPEVLRTISAARPESELEIAQQTTQNAVEFFQLPNLTQN